MSSTHNEQDLTTILARLIGQTKNQDIVANLRTYCGKWARWLRHGITDIISAFDASVSTHMPGIVAVWTATGALGGAAACILF